MFLLPRRLLKLLLFAAAMPLSAQLPGKGGGNGTIITAGPALGFYRLQTKHAINPSPRPAFAAGFRREIRVDRDYRTFIQFGAEYSIYGVNYSSYYFRPSAVKLYDLDFRYRYTLEIQELNLPLQLKVLFNRGNNKLFSPYATATYHLRWLLGSRLQITEFGEPVKKDYPSVRYRNFLFHEKMNAAIAVGIGWQRNKINDKGTAFFAELNLRYGFSDLYFNKDYAANSVFINTTQLFILFGLKF